MSLKFNDTPFHGTLPVGVFLKMWGGIREKVTLSAQSVALPAATDNNVTAVTDNSDEGYPSDIYPANELTHSVITCEDIT